MEKTTPDTSICEANSSFCNAYCNLYGTNNAPKLYTTYKV